MKKMLIVAALMASATALAAQDTKWRPEIRPLAGAVIATGNQRDLFENAPLYGLQGAFEVNPNFHLVGTFGYALLKSKYNVADKDAAMLMYDAGVEFDMVQPLAGDWEMKPFIGAGFGGRSYQFKADALQDKSCTSGYGTVGTEFQLSRIALRVEGRDNLFCYHSPMTGGGSVNRNDVSLNFGLAFHIR